MPVDTRAFYSIVKNDSGVERHFSFLPDGGRTLLANEERSYYGDIRNEIGNKAGSETSARRRDREAFMRAITSGALVVLETPAPILLDATRDAARSIVIDNDLVVVVDPYTGAPPEYPTSSSSSA